MNWLSLRNNQFKSKTLGLILRNLWNIPHFWRRKSRKMSTCNRLILETLGSRQIMPEQIPGHFVLKIGVVHNTCLFKINVIVQSPYDLYNLITRQFASHWKALGRRKVSWRVALHRCSMLRSNTWQANWEHCARIWRKGVHVLRQTHLLS